MLEILSKRQQEARGILESILIAHERGDVTHTEALIEQFASEQEVDVLTNITLIMVQLSRNSNRPITQSDMVYAMEFVDHLDTLGMKIVSKHDGD